MPRYRVQDFDEETGEKQITVHRKIGEIRDFHGNYIADDIQGEVLCHPAEFDSDELAHYQKAAVENGDWDHLVELVESPASKKPAAKRAAEEK